MYSTYTFFYLLINFCEKAYVKALQSKVYLHVLKADWSTIIWLQITNTWID